MWKNIEIPTGVIFYNKEKTIECLGVGDYGKSNNIKADFLGITNKIYDVKHKEVDLSEKYVIALSTQKGCMMNCTFCDVPKVTKNKRIDCSLEDLKEQFYTVINHFKVKHTKRLNLHFVRMGEPTFNSNVLVFAHYISIIFKNKDIKNIIDADIINPVVSTMMPKYNKRLREFLAKWLFIKNKIYNGSAGLQISMNLTDDQERNKIFSNNSLSIEEISNLMNDLLNKNGLIGRRIALNFAVTKGVDINPKILVPLFDPKYYITKITPYHLTQSTKDSGILKEINMKENIDYMYLLEERFKNEGYDCIVNIPSKEEEESRLTCGNALLSNE